MYCVIVGDIIGSREMDFETREAATEAIKEVLLKINEKYKDAILANFGLVRGDALEGVLTASQYAPPIIQEIIRDVHRTQKVKLRFSVAIDALSVVSSDRNEADGPAFYTAVERLNELKEVKSDHWLQISFVMNTAAQPLLDSFFSLISALTEEWTDRQREIAWAMDESFGGQNAVSEALGISPPAVSKQLKAMHYNVYSWAWLNLEWYLLKMEESKSQQGVAAV